jgi:hypothetical protein
MVLDESVSHGSEAVRHTSVGFFSVDSGEGIAEVLFCFLNSNSAEWVLTGRIWVTLLQASNDSVRLICFCTSEM